MAAAAAQFYFRLQIWWCSLQNSRIYQRTKFRSYNSIHSWDITTSGFEKQTSTILEFYFRFWFRLYHRTRHVTLHQSAKFFPNQTAHGIKMTSCRFSRWRISAILDFRVQQAVPLGRRHNMPPPRDFDFWPWSRCGSRMYQNAENRCICHRKIQIYTNIFKFQTGVLCYNKEI